ncbi:MAG: HD domain-containing phosphohydrolase [Thermotaleaceae bacterium]
MTIMPGYQERLTDYRKGFEKSTRRSISLDEIWHGYRVAALAYDISEALGMKIRDKGDIFAAGLFHDIGKIEIEEEVLNKPTKLNAYEREIIEAHVALGVKIGVELGLNCNVINYILNHHENYDGTGYPFRKKGEDISQGGRILRICDVYDALRMDRPYKTVFSHEQAMKILAEEKKNFDPLIYELFIEKASWRGDDFYDGQGAY